MLDFLRGAADVLVCTTIVESGLDIPSANTLIVERADELGLAQLYQIRGRVGRSRERAYAYLLYPSARGPLRGGRAAAVHALRLHGARVGLQDRHARSRDPRGRQPARGGPVRTRGGGGLRALHGDARRGGAPAERGLRRGGRGACADGPSRGRLRARRLRAIRGGQDRAAPARRGRTRDRRPDHAARGARGPLRPGAGAARQPDQASGRAHQARPRRRQDRGLPGRPSGGGADRARLARSARPARGDPGGGVRVRAAAPSAFACPRMPPSASPRWWPRRRRFSRWPREPDMAEER